MIFSFSFLCFCKNAINFNNDRVIQKLQLNSSVLGEVDELKIFSDGDMDITCEMYSAMFGPKQAR